ncbi:MAG: hypothetical protein JXQ30_05335 [Spirochaetes bacterium]|nr:hypothetical protein [Spirochaetota bacterium]
MKYFVGVDLGNVNDFSAIALVEREEEINPGDYGKGILEHIETRYLLRHLERIKDLPYPNVVQRIREMFADPILKRNGTLLVDITGLGLPVYQMLCNEHLSPIGVTITGGEAVSKTGSNYNVPKSQLVSSLMILLQSGRFKRPPDLELGEEFEKEMGSFQYKTNLKTGHVRYEAETEAVHDDLVIAVTLATWYASTSDPHMSEVYGDDDIDERENARYNYLNGRLE